MENIQGFYATHSRWLESHYFGPVDDYRQRYAELIRHFAPGRGRVRVLELGCGGGQAASATADLGARFEVTGIELDPDLALHARKLAEEGGRSNVRILQEDFYKVDLDEHFDVICYWDSFGIGTDHDQRTLLQRIGQWLSPDGVALIDIISTSASIGRTGETQEVIPGKVSRSYSFDDLHSRLIDKWMASQHEITQSFRSYNPDDFRLLALGTGVELDRALAPYVFSLVLEDISCETLRSEDTWLACVKRTI
jgi:SAM-dependent methyltransferase